MTIPSNNSANTLNGCRTTRIYCRPDCPAGRRTHPENRIHFASREEALSSGYRACKVCKPDTASPVPETLLMTRYQSPLGWYTLVSSVRGIVCVSPEEHFPPFLARWQKDGTMVLEGDGYNTRTASELDAYFAGKLRLFTVPLDLRGTDFYRLAWEFLCTIPYGETRTYGEMARALGRPAASRAVGQANGSNPVSIIVPCHRVVGANGKLVGYGGGLDRKQALLDLETSALHQSRNEK